MPFKLVFPYVLVAFVTLIIWTSLTINYPELEKYLVDHRAEYLQYSSCFNYTSEQKRYNNDLTQGLLDLAADEGYVFEEFTFAAVRDRIRCYYKSCVQASKKKRKRR